MKSRKLMLGALSAMLLASAVFAGCEEDGLYKVNAPSDLQNRIDAIAAANAAVSNGDTTLLTITMPAVGAKDNSNGWNSAQSEIFAVPAGKLLHLEFVNYSAGASNWNNWNLAYGPKESTSALDNADEYYFLIRSDAYGWGGTSYSAALLTNDYFEEGKAADWADWLSKMNGAYVTMEIDHTSFGPTYVTVQNLGNDGVTYTEKYTCEGSDAAPAYAWLVCDNSHFEMKKAFLLPSKVAEIADEMPVSLAITGAPAVVEIGNEDFWGNAVATVTYTDGTTAQVDTTDLTFVVVPDMNTVGKKTVTVAYSKSKKGNYCQAVATFYTLEVINPVASLEVTTAPTYTKYYYFSNDSIAFNNEGLVVTATYADGATGVISNASLSFSKIGVTAEKPYALISYVGASATVTVECPVTLVKGVAQVGNVDFSSGWWTAFSDDHKIASGESYTFKMQLYSDNLANYHSPCTILRKADMAEYGVVRMDNFGWGDGYDNSHNESDWNWDIFATSQNNSYIEITVTNNGDNTATVRYDVTYANGEKHFMQYVMNVDSSDLQAALVTEESYLIILE